MAHVLMIEGRTRRPFAMVAEAAEAGHDVTVVLTDPDAYILDGPDFFALRRACALVIAPCTSDPAALTATLLAIDAKRPIDGLIAQNPASALAVATAAEALRLPGEEPAVVSRLQDRLATRRALSGYGVPHPRFGEADSDDLLFPVVVKPVGATDRRSVRIASNRAEVDFARQVFPGATLVEEYVAGPVATAEVWTAAGRHRLLGVSASRGSTFDQNCLEVVADLSFAALDALGVTLGATRVAASLGPGGPVVTEVDGRLAAPLAAPVAAAYGVSRYLPLVDLALGEGGCVLLDAAGPPVPGFVTPSANRAGRITRAARAVHPSAAGRRPRIRVGDLVRAATGNADQFEIRLEHLEGVAGLDKLTVLGRPGEDKECASA